MKHFVVASLVLSFTMHSVMCILRWHMYVHSIFLKLQICFGVYVYQCIHTSCELESI